MQNASKECEHPLCHEPEFKHYRMCEVCFVITIRRIMKAFGGRELDDYNRPPDEHDLLLMKAALQFYEKNFDSMMEREKEKMLIYGPYYDRNNENPPLHLQLVPDGNEEDTDGK